MASVRDSVGFETPSQDGVHSTFAPFGSQQTAVSTTAGGQQVTVVDRSSPLEHEGLTVLVPLAVPVVLALLGIALGVAARTPGVPRTAAGSTATVW